MKDYCNQFSGTYGRKDGRNKRKSGRGVRTSRPYFSDKTTTYREVDIIGNYIIRRLLYTTVVILVAGSITFLLVHLSPGDPAGLMLGPQATSDQIKALREQLGFNRPVLVQYVFWFKDLFQGNLGESVYFGKPVTQIIVRRAEPSLLLTFLSIIIASSIGITIGILSAVKYGTIVDQAFTSIAIFSASIPSFWLGMLFILLFAVQLGWFPTSGYTKIANGGFLNAINHLILPAFCLGIPNSALIVRVTRSTMLDELNKDYLKTARAKGLRQRKVVLRHAFRNTLVPVLTVVGLTLAVLVGGAVVTENVFAIPGIGRLVVMSVLRRDYPVIQGVVMLIAFVYLIVNLLVDISYTFIDPRIRY